MDIGWNDLHWLTDLPLPPSLVHLQKSEKSKICSKTFSVDITSQEEKQTKLMAIEKKNTTIISEAIAMQRLLNPVWCKENDNLNRPRQKMSRSRSPHRPIFLCGNFFNNTVQSWRKTNVQSSACTTPFYSACHTVQCLPDWRWLNDSGSHHQVVTWSAIAQDPPLDLSFWSFLTFLHHSIEEVERHLLWKFYKKIRRKSWSNVPPKLVACIGFLYKVVHKIGRLRKFNRSRGIELNFLTAWIISMKFGTLVQHALGYKTLPQIF